MEPIYSDWLDERNKALTEDSTFDVYRLDIYYYGWFGWRIWKETSYHFSQFPSVFE